MRELLLFLLISCGTEPVQPPAPVPDEPGFTPIEGASPSLRLDGRFAEGLTVDILADGLGPVFGIAGRLAFDPLHLRVESAELSPDLLPDSASLIRTESSAIAFGIARRGASLGDAPLAGQLLATVRFTPLREGDSQLSIERAMVRRADGSFVPAAFLGAELHTIGGTP